MNTIRGKIINPDTNRYVLKTSRKGQEVEKKYKFRATFYTLRPSTSNCFKFRFKGDN